MATYKQFIQQDIPQIKQKKIGNYLIQKTLGKGTFGKVKLATHIPTGQKVAIKILEKEKIIDVADVQRVSRQIHILKLIRHPNIIQLYQIIETPKHLFLIMEYLQGGQLFEYIVNKKRMDEQQACKAFQQIISGIEYIHKLRIVHRDLKLQNCLIDYDKSIRIVDFGLSNTYKQEQRLRTACGSPCYAAPQMIEGKAPYEPIMVDIWSAGVILFAMVCGYLPFEDKDTSKLYRKILNGQYETSSYVSPELNDFLSKILTINPAQRIKIQEMKQHKWWKRYSANYYPEGLIVGYHKVPIQALILKQIRLLGFDPQLTQKSLETNLHNNLTTTYYIILKKYLRQGQISKNTTICGQSAQVIKRRSKSNLKTADILKIITTPLQKKRAKSYYLGTRSRDKHVVVDDCKSLGSNSVRIENKKKSASKFKQNKTIFDRDSSYNNSKLFKPTTKSQKKDKSMNKSNKSMNKSSSKYKKTPKNDYQIQEENYVKERSQSQKRKIGNKKQSHQASYIIGADSGTDWPLQPKWKGENGKSKHGIRKR